MEWKLRNTICELETLKEKLDDVATAHAWHGENMFKYKELKNNTAKEYYMYGYDESRIHHEQTNDLLTLHLKEFDELISKFKALDIKRGRTHDEIGNGQHNVEQ